MISPTTLDLWRKVTYSPVGGPKEVGVITRITTDFIFVKFADDLFSKACRRQDLEWNNR